MPQSFDTLRVGHTYVLTNYGETNKFLITEIHEGDHFVKDIETLETYFLSNLIKYGKGPDYDLYELGE